MSKNILLAVSSIAALALVALLGFQVAGAWRPATVAQAQSTPAALPRTITVVGEGRVSARPDIAAISVGVQVNSPDIKEATTQAASQMDKIMAALKAQGIAEKDIQTNNYSISYESRAAAFPETSNVMRPASGEPAGIYHVSNMAQVKVRDLKKISAVIDEVVNAGANNLWGISFTLEDSSKVEAEARAKAVANAKARAEEFAKLAGVKVGALLQLSEVMSGGPVIGRYALDAVKFGGGAGPVSPGELEITFQVQAIYAIE